MKRVLTAVLSIATAGVLAACGSGPAPRAAPAAAPATARSPWASPRSARRAAGARRTPRPSRDAAKAADINLKFSDANGEQENQISAIRSFVQQRVNVIAFSPVVRTGWDAVLLEAKNAGIPVILTDRAVDTQENDVYKTFLGADFVQEGKWAGEWTVKEFAAAPGPVNIVQLEGTTGSDPALERSSGFADAINANPNLKVIASQTGDFTRSGGKQVMEAFLKANPKIDMVFAQNDDMALGAVEAIEAAGMKPGQDIKIVAIDATHDGMQALADGKFNFIVECNPLLGPATDGPRQEGRRRRVGAGPRRDPGSDLRPAAGGRRPARTQVLTLTEQSRTVYRRNLR